MLVVPEFSPADAEMEPVVITDLPAPANNMLSGSAAPAEASAVTIEFFGADGDGTAVRPMALRPSFRLPCRAMWWKPTGRQTRRWPPGQDRSSAYPKPRSRCRRV